MADTITGKDAYATGMSCVTGYTISEAVAEKTYQASCTGGGSNTVLGAVNTTGQISGVGFGAPALTGADLTVVFAVEAQGAGNQLSYAGDILISQVIYTFPVKDGGPITWTANFGVQGTISPVEAGDVLDTNYEPAAVADGVQIKLLDVIGAGAVPNTILTDVQDIVLTMTRSESTTTQSGHTHRAAGNFTANLALKVENKNRSGLVHYEKGYSSEIQILDDDDAVIARLGWMTCRGKTNFNVNRESNSLVGFDTSYAWSYQVLRVLPSTTTPIAAAANNSGFCIINGTTVFGAVPVYPS